MRLCLAVALLHASALSGQVCQPPAVQAPAATSHAPASVRATQQIDSAIKAEMHREKIPGLSLAVMTNNRALWERAYGFADLEACVATTPATVYRLASVSKTITAAAAMQLVEAGRLDLDAPIQRYVPSFPEKGKPITSRQLLSHLSGIRHYQGDEELSIREYPSLTSALAIFASDTLVAAPGTTFSYTTYGYTLLGAALEAASGESYVAYLRAHIFAPLGLTTIRDDSAAVLIAHRARGYSRDSSETVRNAAFLNSSYKIPGGGLVSNAGDLARFAAGLQAGRLVKPETFRQMGTSARTIDGAEVPYGYGLIIGQIPGILPGALWHGGVQQGFTTMVYMLPESQLSVVVLTNMEGIGGSLASLTNDIARIVQAELRATH